MAYTKTTWVNGSAPPISAENLNNMEDGIYNNDAAIQGLLSKLPFFKFKKFTWPSATYNANSTTWVYSQNVHAPSIAGYTAVGVLQSTPDSGGAALVVQISLIPEDYGDRFIGMVRNVGSSNQTVTLALALMYVKNELL